MPTTWYRAPDEEFTSTADAIRTQTGDSAQIEWKLHKGFADAIMAIPTGGSAESKPKAFGDVMFYDYDGTVVASYTAEDFAELEALPPVPQHDGLTAQGWNWSLADAKAYVAKYGGIDVGQNYITDDGKTRIYLTLVDGRLEPFLGLGVNGSVLVDWGDNSTSTVTGSNVDTLIRTKHTYAKPGDYVISLTVTGTAKFLGDPNSKSHLLTAEDTAALNPILAYQSCVTKIEIGSNVLIGDSGIRGFNKMITCTLPSGMTTIERCAFEGCMSLSNLTIPPTVTSIGGAALKYCRSMQYVLLPKTVTAIGQYAFQWCDGLRSFIAPEGVTTIEEGTLLGCYTLWRAIFPDTVTSIGDRAFDTCHILREFTIPTSVTSIGTRAFYSCSVLRSAEIPSGVTTISSLAFSGAGLRTVTIPDTVTSIESGAFEVTAALTNLTIPASVTSIASRAFYQGLGLGYIKFMPSTPPTVENADAFGLLQEDCIIMVPAGSLNAYKSATNYPSPSTYTYVEY